MLKVHSDDISNVLILNKKAIASQESQLFKAELEKFRPHQNRILQANHKQGSLLKELTRTYSDLLKDPRVRSEQSKYDSFSRQRDSVMKKYKRVYQSFNDLQAGLTRAQGFYSEMKETVSSLQKNVETFVNNRRSEGGQLLQNIEHKKNQGADQEQQRLKDLMERMSMEPSGSPVSASGRDRKKSIPAPLSSTPLNQGSYQATTSVTHHAYNPAASPPVTPRYPVTSQSSQQYQHTATHQHPSYASNSNGYQPQYPPHSHSHSHSHSQSQSSYNPTNYGPVSPPAHQQYFSPPPNQQQQQPWGQPPTQHPSQHQHQQYSYGGGTPQPGAQQLPQGYVPPPPPPGPPPSQYSQYQGGYTQPQQGQQGGAHDLWAGLSQWK